MLRGTTPSSHETGQHGWRLASFIGTVGEPCAQCLRSLSCQRAHACSAAPWGDRSIRIALDQSHAAGLKRLSRCSTWSSPRFISARACRVRGNWAAKMQGHVRQWLRGPGKQLVRVDKAGSSWARARRGAHGHSRTIVAALRVHRRSTTFIARPAAAGTGGPAWDGTRSVRGIRRCGPLYMLVIALVALCQRCASTCRRMPGPQVSMIGAGRSFA